MSEPSRNAQVWNQKGTAYAGARPNPGEGRVSGGVVLVNAQDVADRVGVRRSTPVPAASTSSAMARGTGWSLPPGGNRLQL